VSRAPLHPRAFALPMVLILVLVSGIILAVMFERQAAQALTVERELETYRFHHISRGVQEAVEAWIRNNSNSDIAGALDIDGHAFDLQVEGAQPGRGGMVHIYFYEAQDKVLADFSGLSGDALDAAGGVLIRLRDEQGSKALNFVRREGPVPISVNTAPDEVLHAALGSVLDLNQTNSLIGEIRSARKEGTLIDSQALTGLLNNAGVDAQTLPKVQGLITAQPVLWQVVAEADPPAGVYPVPQPVRYGGTAIINGQAGNKNASLQRNSSFVSWEKLPDR
jgi:hypothetical protein